MSDDVARFLRSATGAGDRFQLAVAGDGDASSTQYEFEYPYVVIGRGEDCDIPLADSKVSFRHAYFQVIEGRVFCIDLASRNGVLWPDGPRKYGWVAPGMPIRIGPYTVKVLSDQAHDQSLPETSDDLNPLERYRGQAGAMPKVDLEFRYETAHQPTWSVNRLLVLLGRSPLCKLRFETRTVSAVHCSLLLTRHGLWAIDLMGRRGTLVDGEPIRAIPLESGSEISIGDYQIGVFYEEPVDLAAPERLTDNAAESETSMSDLESPFLQDVPLPDGVLEPRSEPAAKSSSPTWLGTVFNIEAVDKTLIVVPTIDGCGFRYQQLHIEANSLQRKLEVKDFASLVVDLHQLNYFGSELIGVLIRLARTVTNGQGRAAFCSPSGRMLEVLESMRINKLWPIFASRDEALKHVKE